MKAGLSQRGYMTATAIMELESLLGALEQREREGGRQAEGFGRDPVRYFFSVFGTPSAKGTWGWRVEGHHVSLHFTMANGNARGELAVDVRIRIRRKCSTARARARASSRRRKTRRASC